MTEDVNDLISLRLDEMDFILKAVMKAAEAGDMHGIDVGIPLAIGKVDDMKMIITNISQ